ncbi:MAG: ATP-dependent helicase RecG [Moraxellaceae bacterium]|jgi:ATP-dependent DNA helicase RecG|nr:ATP-dependent helicase RecG [Moraxellaceae bacterium]
MVVAVAAPDNLARMPVTSLKGVGAALADKLLKLDIRSVQDLLFHLPRQYEDRSHVTPIGALRQGMTALVEGEVQLADVAMGRRRSLVVRVHDGTGALTLRFYHFRLTQKDGLPRGTRLRIFGEARTGSSGLEMYHPEYQVAPEDLPPPPDTLTPIYPVTEGVTQPRIRALVTLALARLEREGLPDWLPSRRAGGWSLPDALRYVHAPPTDADRALLQEGRHPAQQRLVFEELVAHQISLQKRRAEIRAQRAVALPLKTRLAQNFLAQLGFALTGAQKRVLNEIAADLHIPHPMLRLVQGDVGAGKTVVAALAACHALEAGYQVALMAPTEILAEQHAVNFTRWFDALGVPVVTLLGKLGVKARRAANEAIASGSAGLAIGTHALFQDEVRFRNLALVIVDEQHRFGVHQRLALKQKGMGGGLAPHQLIMTATPIPRTLAMSAYGDLDTSVIDELPPGRTPIQTLVIPNDRRVEIVERIRVQCLAGKQAYWVCTLIEESEQLQAQAAEATYAELQVSLPELRIGLVHGRQRPGEKSAVMQAFKNGELQLLVATTVIEVGVDVPNATLMVIENPERLGLAQLHQLRGRVGRGAQQSFCVLLYQTPLGQLGRARLATLRDTTDGFRIAEKDLELRGPGEVLGTRQTGVTQFRLADLLRDAPLLPAVQDCARDLLVQQPEAAEALLARWVAAREHYAQV